VQMATEEKSEIAVAEAALAEAKAKLHAAEATLTGARIGHEEALRTYFDIAGKLSDLRSTRMMGGQKV
jgi:hypothetical protein